MGVTFFLGSATFSSALELASLEEIMGSLDKSKATVRRAARKIGFIVKHYMILIR